MEIELSRILRAIRRYWWVVAASMVVFALAAILIWSVLPKSYTTSAKLLVLPSSISGVTLSQNGGSVTTYMELTESDTVLFPVMEEFGIDETTDEFRETIAVSNIAGTDMILVQVTDTDPQRAADIANALTTSSTLRVESLTLGVIQAKRDALVFERDQIDLQLTTVNTNIEQLGEIEGELSSEDQTRLNQFRTEQIHLEQQRADLNASIRSTEMQLATTQAPITVSDVAVSPVKPNGLSRTVVAVLGTVLGGLIGSGLMMVLELRDSRIRDAHQLAELANVRSIVPIPRQANTTEGSASMRLFASRIAGLAHRTHRSSILLVTPQATNAVDKVAEQLKSMPDLQMFEPVAFSGLLDAHNGTHAVPEKTAAVLLIDQSRTRDSDVIEVVNALDDLGIPIISAALLE